ncbi:membrane protein [Rhodococcoides trifolii]|uniref:Membrane protein n=1 Tax=Rhodococcoides trifolii TaxID=908250 RepID=A0A917D2Z7_9NOCA|nr:PH domain-containing protein [Rhodococcus trifolii]GGG09391.1 membrane protein [Rhodococcus trifolii]
MTENTTEVPEWELEARPRKSARYAIAVAALLILVHLTLGILLRTGATGVYFQRVDQIGIFLIGCGLGGGVLLLTRPRVRVGAKGVLVRNLVTEKFVEWDLVNSLSFPPGASWARIEIPDDEYIPVMAIQANDREYAVAAARKFRALERKYGSSVAE